jgi:4'-phosphopantetheinyl transferase
MLEQWKAVTELPPLGAEDLQLWRIDLADATSSPETYLCHLSPEEQDRASRLRAGQVQMQFVVARACLRTLLGFHLQLAPKDVPILLGSHGKPEIPAIHGRNLFFNFAHSRSTIVIAFCSTGPVGVDLEYLDRDTDIMEVASNAFTQRECCAIEDLEDLILRRRAFFRCWTRKEAVVKADGRGLSLPLTSFEVPVIESASSVPVIVTETGDLLRSSRSYYVSDMPLGEQLAGAYALEKPGMRCGHVPLPADAGFLLNSPPYRSIVLKLLPL